MNCLSVHYKLWNLWVQVLLTFKAMCVVVHLWSAGLKKWSAKYGVQTLCSAGRSVSCASSQLWLLSWGWCLWWDCISASPTHFNMDVGFFLFDWCVGVAYWVFLGGGGGVVLDSFIKICGFGVSMREDEFRIFFVHCHLEPEPNNLILIFKMRKW